MGLFDFFFGKKSTPPSPSDTEAPSRIRSGGQPTPSHQPTEEEDWQNQGTPQEVQPAEVEALLKSSNPPQLLDVREEFELKADGIIPGSHHIPLADVSRRCKELDPNRPVVVYCASGMRSFDAGFTLIQKGFQDVSNLNGGIHAWRGEKASYKP